MQFKGAVSVVHNRLIIRATLHGVSEDLLQDIMLDIIAHGRKREWRLIEARTITHGVYLVVRPQRPAKEELEGLVRFLSHWNRKELPNNIRWLTNKTVFFKIDVSEPIAHMAS